MSKCKQPHPTELQKLVKPMVEILTDAMERTEGKRTDPFNHQKTIAEFLQALTWVGLTADAGVASRSFLKSPLLQESRPSTWTCVGKVPSFMETRF